MEERPKIKIKWDRYDAILEIAVILLLLTSCFLVAYNYKRLPDQIPTHFNFKGEIDSFGSKKSIWGLLLIETILYLVITILNQYPHVFNYPTTITQENAENQYKKATKLLRVLKLILVIVFGYLVLKVMP